jgi:hypothetical protein
MGMLQSQLNDVQSSTMRKDEVTRLIEEVNILLPPLNFKNYFVATKQ